MRAYCFAHRIASLLIATAFATAFDANADPIPNGPKPPRRYAVSDLGVTERLAADIVPGLSASGKVVSWRRADESFVAVLLDGAAEKSLLPPKGFHNSFAYSVNDLGHAVGWSNTTVNPVDSSSTVHAVYFDANGAVDIGTLGGLRSRAYAINNSDVVVGVSELENLDQRGFRYEKGQMRSLDALPGGRYSAAFDINDTGVIVGGSGLPSISIKPSIHAVLWQEGKPTDLGTLDGAGSSVAYAINNRGDVIGVSDIAGAETVFLYSRGRMNSLGIRGHAFAINNAGQIVGTLMPPKRGPPRGFLWENGVVYDINTLTANGDFRVESAYRINDHGQILCTGVDDGRLHTLLLNPIDQ